MTKDYEKAFEEAKEKTKEISVERAKPTAKDSGKMEAILKAAKMPIEFKDGDLRLGEREWDIRKCSRATKDQIAFRNGWMQTARLDDICQSLVDIQRLIIVLLAKMGVDDIAAAIGETMGKLAEQASEIAGKGE